MQPLAVLLDAIENKRWPASAKLPEPIPVNDDVAGLEEVLNKPYNPNEFIMPAKREAVTTIVDTPLSEGPKEPIMLLENEKGKVLAPKTDLGENIRQNYNQQINRQSADLAQDREAMAKAKEQAQSGRDMTLNSIKARIAAAAAPFPELESTDIGIAKRLDELDKRRAAIESAPAEGEDLLTKLIYSFGPGLLGAGMGGTAGYKSALPVYEDVQKQQKESRERAAKLKERKAETAYKEMLSLGKLAEGVAQKDKQAFDARVAEIEKRSQMLDKITDDINQVYSKDSEAYKMLMDSVNKARERDFDAFKSGVGEMSDVEMKQMDIESQEKRAGIAANAKKVAQAKTQNKDTMALRKEYNARPIVKDFNEIDSSLRKMRELGDTPAGDLSMIFAYMKMLDPTSVVREGEQTLAIRTAGIPDRIWNAYEQAKTGQKLNPVQRKQFREEAFGLYTAKKSQLEDVQNEFSRIAEKTGIDPSLVFQPARPITKEEATKQPPSAEDKAILDLVNKNPQDKSPKMERLRNVLRKKGLLK